MVVHNEFSDRIPQRIFTKENHPLETTFFDRAHKAFCIRIQIRRLRRHLALVACLVIVSQVRQPTRGRPAQHFSHRRSRGGASFSWPRGTAALPHDTTLSLNPCARNIGRSRFPCRPILISLVNDLRARGRFLPKWRIRRMETMRRGA